MDDHIGLRICVETLDGSHLDEVVVLAAGNNNLCASASMELFHDERAQEAGSARDDDTCINPEGWHMKPKVEVEVKVE
jgi:hypothetical protein